MKVFVIGSDGKIHSLVWKLTRSSKVSRVFCTFNNAVMKEMAEFVDIRENEVDRLYEFIKENKIDLTVVESLTTANTGLVDRLREEGLSVFGPGKNSGKIEMARGFTKKFIHKYKIPTPKFGVYDKETQAVTYARTAEYPQVVKFDSRMPGTGTVVCKSFNEAKNVISFCLKNQYKPVLLENYIPGRQISFQVITDGYNAVPLPVAHLYKKSEDGNLGFNTEGMGAYSPVSYIDAEMEAKIAERIFFPVIDGLNSEKMEYAGVLRASIIIDEKNEPQLAGLNVSFGGPETQTILPLLEDDLFDIMMLSSMGALSDTYEVFNISDEHSVCVTLASEGYPGEYKKGVVIEGLDEVDDDNTYVFHAGTRKNIYGETVTTAGRVLDIVSKGSTLNRAQKLVYEAVDMIEFPGMKYRKDIAKPIVLT